MKQITRYNHADNNYAYFFPEFIDEKGNLLMTCEEVQPFIELMTTNIGYKTKNFEFFSLANRPLECMMFKTDNYAVPALRYNNDLVN